MSCIAGNSENGGEREGVERGCGGGRMVTAYLFILLLANLTVAVTEVIIPTIDHLDV